MVRDKGTIACADPTCLTNKIVRLEVTERNLELDSLRLRYYEGRTIERGYLDPWLFLTARS